MPIPLPAAPPVCQATVAALPATGGGVAPLVFLAVALLLTGGVVLLLRRRTGRITVAALALTVVLVALPGNEGPVQAATGGVSYTDGCTVIEVGDIVLDASTANILPGDRVAAISAVVTNTFSRSIEVSAEARLDAASTLAQAFTAEVELGGQADEVVLGAGETVTAELFLTLPETVGNGVQASGTPVSLVVTAVQR
ncbi:LPXTG cell wall anchor domain-containing protein [Salinibacterium sp. dk2585]|uniref:LPXTG cell wall anchor domain-containing protein n=1 Tax=unclassified Salinibacterium TaxID=2632331 RepID=UPI0011C24330|nr:MULTISPECIES: LPXTG cell wall anchor domain-containing protein [unclassified Salinibacterium]QEE62173.1 LPXTG cell wall anchor domain-containing protein [Salinibacterium sp. dk2585]TXK53525.1 LPXTG cell wall anchor domain-containing protein [Salinibacterium sp. dk5596]